MGDVIENSENIAVEQPANANVLSLSSVFEPRERSALVILNQPITIPLLEQLWLKYSLKVCGDGGANRLFDHFTNEHERVKYLPHFIVGDFDSLRDDVRTFYEDHGVGVLPQTTQWATDMDKCLDLVEVYFDHVDRGLKLDVSSINHYDGIVSLHKDITDQQPIDVLMFGAIDGRFDHTIHSISVLLKLLKLNPGLRLYYLTFTDIIFLIPKGINYLDYSEAPYFHGSNCGLLPLGGDVVLTTQGLKWDVIEWPTSLKGSVSSSNRLVGDKGVVINTDNDFIMNIEMSYDHM